MRISTFLFLLFCLISCKDKQLQITEFDEIIHYKLDILRVDEIDITDILSGEAIQNISDTLIIDQFTESGFLKSEVDKSDYIKLNQVLTSTENTKDNTKCLPVYRDFLILKKKNETVCIFKICFECSQLNYIDASTNEERLLTDENSLVLDKLFQ
ncbi:MAG: hypothetical protein RSF68_13845 [Myroides sp.]